MIARKDYMDGKVSHDDYYAQFATPEVRNAVLRHIGADAIKRSTDPHMNDIPLRKWDAIIGWSDFGVARPSTDLCIGKMLRDAGDSVSASTLVCAMKAAARAIKAELE